MQIDTGADLRCRVEEGDGRQAVLLDGELCLPAVGGLRQVLIEALATGRGASVWLSGVTATDFAGLQLLCSAHRTFRQRGAALSVEGASLGFRETAQAAGFDSRCSTCRFGDDSCLWKA
jgi:anti-anti-sigma regulatory factor